MIGRAIMLAGLAAVASSCLRFGYGVTHIQEPVDHGILVALRPGVDDLTSCLARLGAPNHVFEYRGDGVALAWHYTDASDLDVDLSYAVSREATSASFSLDWDDTDMPGAVLWFDADLRLLEVREGAMRDLTGGLRLRPSDAGDDDGG